jgi:membrane protease YdiL (CAAX protease family)
MDTTIRVVGAAAAHADITIPQYGRKAILATWAAAALPMAAGSWLLAPVLADRLSGEGSIPMVKALFLTLTIGLIWQFVLVALLVRREQGNLRWSTVREALWLRSPRSPKNGRVGGRVWFIVIPFILLVGIEGFLPGPPVPANRDLGLFLESDAGQGFFSGNWTWYAIFMVSEIFNTVLGEELLFRGYLLPRMNGAFGRGDWVANGVLFAAYHLHMPWRIPLILLDSVALSYPTKRYRSAWMGIAVHSVQTVFFGVILLALVLK